MDWKDLHNNLYYYSQKSTRLSIESHPPGTLANITYCGGFYIGQLPIWLYWWFNGEVYSKLEECYTHSLQIVSVTSELCVSNFHLSAHLISFPIHCVFNAHWIKAQSSMSTGLWLCVCRCRLDWLSEQSNCICTLTIQNTSQPHHCYRCTWESIGGHS